ncbi:monovalent cation/H+ antiporter complex subunit F [Gracilinema caldarium]|uniref:Multiple resistance and pH regulation protein F n=1 Tax=Gracilinema caldarium (strain ATCC 51460 / DSM 7334 / H1) TaxID=744872 RepID=F8F1G7_GRAC1|nr:monovalent cation/H+ antiporter complex subunit F [Gracilinema caldarium]AEJ19020.1 multiple resistance and pH regulation protein F [Gracilinema caldarium DSM 7334]
MKDEIFFITSWVFILCIGMSLIRLLLGPRGADRLTALAVISSLILALLVLYGTQEGRLLYLDVALLYDVFGFLGILAIAQFFRDKESGERKL